MRQRFNGSRGSLSFRGELDLCSPGSLNSWNSGFADSSVTSEHGSGSGKTTAESGDDSDSWAGQIGLSEWTGTGLC